MPEIRAVQTVPASGAVSAFDKAYGGGKASLQRNQIGLALVLFQKALAVRPDSVAALNAVGAAYDELHFPNLAARYYARALEIAPGSADTLNNMAVSAALAGRMDEARSLVAAALAIETGNPILLANVGLLARQGLAQPSVAGQLLRGEPVVERIGIAAFSLTIQPPTRPVPGNRGVAAPRLAVPQPELIAMTR